MNHIFNQSDLGRSIMTALRERCRALSCDVTVQKRLSVSLKERIIISQRSDSCLMQELYLWRSHESDSMAHCFLFVFLATLVKRKQPIVSRPVRTNKRGGRDSFEGTRFHHQVPHLPHTGDAHLLSGDGCQCPGLHVHWRQGKMSKT